MALTGFELRIPEILTLGKIKTKSSTSSDLKRDYVVMRPVYINKSFDEERKDISTELGKFFHGLSGLALPKGKVDRITELLKNETTVNKNKDYDEELFLLLKELFEIDLYKSKIKSQIDSAEIVSYLNKKSKEHRPLEKKDSDIKYFLPKFNKEGKIVVDARTGKKSYSKIVFQPVTETAFNSFFEALNTKNNKSKEMKMKIASFKEMLSKLAQQRDSSSPARLIGDTVVNEVDLQSIARDIFNIKSFQKTNKSTGGTGGTGVTGGGRIRREDSAAATGERRETEEARVARERREAEAARAERERRETEAATRRVDAGDGADVHNERRETEEARVARERRETEESTRRADTGDGADADASGAGADPDAGGAADAGADADAGGAADNERRETPPATPTEITVGGRGKKKPLLSRIGLFFAHHWLSVLLIVAAATVAVLTFTNPVVMTFLTTVALPAILKFNLMSMALAALSVITLETLRRKVFKNRKRRRLAEKKVWKKKARADRKMDAIARLTLRQKTLKENLQAVRSHGYSSGVKRTQERLLTAQMKDNAKALSSAATKAQDAWTAVAKKTEKENKYSQKIEDGKRGLKVEMRDGRPRITRGGVIKQDNILNLQKIYEEERSRSGNVLASALKELKESRELLATTNTTTTTTNTTTTTANTTSANPATIQMLTDAENNIAALGSNIGYTANPPANPTAGR